VRRRTEITIETEEVIVIRQRRRLFRAYCAGCAQQVIMVTVDQAAAAADKSSRLIYRMAEAGSIHFLETPEGFLLICLQSLISSDRNDVNCPDQDDARDYYERSSNKLKQI
jgi:hypothetical protein